MYAKSMSGDLIWKAWFRAIQFAPRRARWRLARRCFSPKEPTSIILKLRSGLVMKLDISEKYQRTVAASGYEYDILDVTSSILRKGDCVIDVGANIGLHSLIWAQLVGPKGRVVSFEPVPPNFETLVGNTKLNPKITCIKPLNVALGETQAQLRFSAPQDRAGLTSGSYSATRVGGSEYVVQQTTMDAFTSKLEPSLRIRLVKIDVEGWESRVIDGALNTIQKHLPYLAIEWNREYESCDELYEIIWGILVPRLGYRPTRVVRSRFAGRGNLVDLSISSESWPRLCNLFLVPKPKNEAANNVGEQSLNSAVRSRYSPQDVT